MSQLSRNHAILLAGTLLFALSRLVPPPAGLSPEAWGVASVGALMALFALNRLVQVFAPTAEAAAAQPAPQEGDL